MPCGNIEPGETILDATKRELEEETGLHVTPVKTFYSGELIGSSEFHRPAHFIFFTSLFETNDTAAELEERKLSNY